MKYAKLLIVIAALIALLLLSLLVRDVYFNGGTDESSSGETAATDMLLQYEWPQLQGDSSFSRFSEGPAPEAPDILWKTNITGIQSYVSAFNGKVFVTTKTEVFALDKETGSILWHTEVPAPGSWPSVYKIDDSHLIVGNSSLDVETGEILWTSPVFSANPLPFFVANVYSPEEKMFYVKTGSYVQGWDFSDPSNPPTLKWETYDADGGTVGSGVQYGDGKVFPGSYGPHQMALDARTGDKLWDTETKSPMVFSGVYSASKFFRGGTHDNSLYCFDANSGEVLWTFNPHTEDGYFCIGPAVAYGMVYELNKDGNLYALDVDTGDLVWKYKGPGPLIFPGNPTVADGKIYATTGQTASYTGQESTSEFACLDVYTGRVIWKLPIEAFAPRESVAVAYGNLYLIPGDVTTSVDVESGEEYSTFNQVWAIGTKSWPMFRHDPAHTATGQSAPKNLTLRWNFTTGGAVISSPSIADGRVYVGSHDKNLYCLDTRTGSFIWKFATNDRIKSSPAIAESRVYVGPDDGYVYCLDASNGSLIWSTYAGGPIQVNFGAAPALRSSPTVVGGKVYVGSLDTNVYCLDGGDGNVDWAFKTEGHITSSPAVADGAVYVVSQEPESGALFKLNAEDGSFIWKRELPYEEIQTGGTDMHASPTAVNGRVFSSSNVKRYYGISAVSGDLEWTYQTSGAGEFIVCSPPYENGNLFIVDHFSIVCVNASTGEAVWNTYLGEELYVSPSYADGKVYVVTDQRSVYVLNATDGEKLAGFKTESNSWSSCALYEGRVYVGSNDWNIYCLAESPATTGTISLELPEQVAVGESVTGIGYLSPAYPNASVTVSFVKPDDSFTGTQVVTSKQGAFNFTLKPDASGNWTIAAQWQTDKSYYTSAYGDATLDVTEVSQTNIPVAVIAIAVIAFAVVLAILGFVVIKRGAKKQL
jgi:outer membrane protein assembly factor BamB